METPNFKEINIYITKKIEYLLRKLHINYSDQGHYFSGICPIHRNSDNPRALIVYKQSGYWRCNTKHCEHVFKSSPLGLIRGILSAKQGWKSKEDRAFSLQNTIDFIYEKPIKFVNNTNTLGPPLFIEEKQEQKIRIEKNTILKNTRIPSEYYLNRGFSEEILKKYSVGECKNPDKPFYQRAVVPIFDEDYKYIVGCTGRSIYEKCLVCSEYHKTGQKCGQKGKNPKWYHQFNFKCNHHLYNFWFAKDRINKSGVAILVEGPTDVWKLEENGIHNSLAIFGTSISKIQRKLLAKSGALKIRIIMDNDEAGEHAYNELYKRLKYSYNIERIFLPTNDIAELSSKQIKEILK